MKKFWHRFFKLIAIFILIILLTVTAFFMAVYNGVFGPFPSREEMAAIQNEEASLVFSSDGEIIGKYFAENRTNITWDDIPEHLINALVATEDKRYFLHDGYDSRSYLRVLTKTILLGDKSSGGGSTLTQQLVKNLYGRNDHSFMSMPVNKLKEAIIAVRMEKVLTKQQILLLYLNSVPFGEDVYGVEAASMRYFGKHCSELNIQESAVLVGMLKANTFYNPRLNPENAVNRRNQVLALMLNEKYLSQSEYDSLKATKLVLSYSNYQLEAPAGYFVYRVRKKAEEILESINKAGMGDYNLRKDGLEIHTTLNSKLQQTARNSIKQQLSAKQKYLDNQLKNSYTYKQWLKETQNKYSQEQLDEVKNRMVFNWSGEKAHEMSLADSLWHYYSMLNAAVLITEPESGRVLTWVGGNNYRYLPYDMVLAKRQIASAIKPIVYSAALEKGLTPCDYLHNEVVEYKEYDGWTPRNYDNSSSKDTLVALWYALANSMNLPTMDLYFQTGYESVNDMLRRFQLDAPVSETPAVALGALDVSLYEIVKAYGAFADNGFLRDDLVMIDKIVDAQGNIIYENEATASEQVISAEVANEITNILETAVNKGTGRQLRYRFGIKADLAGKTGTAQNYSNAWFLTYTPDIVVGTWVGARSPEVHMRGGAGSGSALALPIAGNILKYIEGNPSLDSEYFTDFNFSLADSASIDCDPFFVKGLPGFIDRLTGDKDKDKSDRKQKKEERKANREKTKKERSGIRKFFDNIFKKKKR